ncbi:hypothetical protein N864_11370 [Intrasporangium chromatireducens Q5-1]|uniref:Transposase IS116/IS110/IS902 C-terminal domain-containing protein n=1 Tax=Intrasporangium chromatireducens Q5-1 TaxID=584657 RepID=W9GE96_9MICO|nr:hypothetical protein N864_11370 [Intrasporangium chromatireducens Q5-1]
MLRGWRARWDVPDVKQLTRQLSSELVAGDLTSASPFGIVDDRADLRGLQVDLMSATRDPMYERVTVSRGRWEALDLSGADTVARLDQIPGIGPAAAGMIIAEIGTDMTRFPTAAHLASWAKFSPTVKQSAGKTKGNAATGRGNRYLARALGEAAVGASRTNTFLGERFRRIARRRGKQRALVAIGRSILTVIWHLLSDPTATFNDLGADHYDNRGSTQRALRRHVNALHALGFAVTITPSG